MFPVKDDIPTVRTTPVHYGVIGICALVFAWQLLFTQPPYRGSLEFGVIPAALFNAYPWTFPSAVPPWMTLITSQFLHGGWMHIIGNMMFLYIFGNNVEEAYGSVRFIVLYLVCGVAAGLAQSLLDPSSIIPMIGASGAISGVLGAYLKLFPKAEVTAMFFIGIFVKLSARWFLLLWFAYQAGAAFLTSGTAGSTGGTAFLAHVGGFVAGFAISLVWKPRRFIRSPWQR